MDIIGLTGNIGSGKSTVGEMLRSLGAAVIDCDCISHQLTAPHMPCLAQIIQSFGEEYLCADGSLNRKKLAAHIFANLGERQKLEQILHPAIAGEVQRQVTEHRWQGTECVVVEAPLLIEAGLLDLVDRVWLVVSSRESKLERLTRHRGYEREQGEIALANQMQEDEMLPYADVIIENRGSLEDLQQTVRRLWQTYLIERGERKEQ